MTTIKDQDAVFRFTESQRGALAPMTPEHIDDIERFVTRLRIDAEKYGQGLTLPTKREAASLARALATIEGLRKRPWAALWFPSHSALYDVRFGGLCGTIDLVCQMSQERKKGPAPDVFGGHLKHGLLSRLDGLSYGAKLKAYQSIVEAVTGRRVGDAAREVAIARRETSNASGAMKRTRRKSKG